MLDLVFKHICANLLPVLVSKRRIIFVLPRCLSAHFEPKWEQNWRISQKTLESLPVRSSALMPTHCTKHESAKNQHNTAPFGENIPLIHFWPYLHVPLWYLLTKSWQYFWLECLELDTSAVCPVVSYFLRQIWNTKTRALSFTISNNTYFIYTGTKLWTGDQCSGQTHFLYTFKNMCFF